MDDYLFTKKDLGSLICYYPVAIREIVESWDKNKVLGASETDLIDCLVQEVTLDAPKLHPREYWRVASDEAKIDVSHDFRYAPPIHDRSIVVDGQRITVEVPFDGDADLFDFRPSTRSKIGAWFPSWSDASELATDAKELFGRIDAQNCAPPKLRIRQNHDAS